MNTEWKKGVLSQQKNVILIVYKDNMLQLKDTKYLICPFSVWSIYTFLEFYSKKLYILAELEFN